MDFFKEKIIIDKNLTRSYANCDSLKLRFLKYIWILLCLIFCNLSVFNFPINSFRITFICLSPWVLAKHFTAYRLSSVSDPVIFLTSCSASAISSSKSLIKTLSSDCKTSAIPFYRHSCHQSKCVGSTAGSGVSVSTQKLIVVSLEICANTSWNSVSILTNVNACQTWRMHQC